MERKIIDVKNPLLRAKAKPVKKIDKKIHDLVRDMQETLLSQKDPEGVGLAAPQVGKSLRLFLINYGRENLVIINPEILDIDTEKTNSKYSSSSSRKKNSVLEGCLSLPHYYGPIKRSKRLTLKYMNLEGNIITREFKDFLAHIIQHEVDHLNGILFIDKILEQKTPLYKFDGDQWEEVEL